MITACCALATGCAAPTAVSDAGSRPQLAHGVEGTPVAITEEQASLLQGRWSGIYESKRLGGRRGGGYYADSVTLEVTRTSPLGGRFSHGSGQTWDTGVVIRDGKVHMTFGRETRPFTLSKDGEGRLVLSVSYDSEHQGTPTSNTAMLRKQ